MNRVSGADPATHEPSQSTLSRPFGECPGEWCAAGFMAKTDQGEHEVAGWVNGLFALDFRIWSAPDEWDEGYDRGWLLTHLPTGHQMFGIIAPLTEARQIADRVAELTDWSFDDPAAAKGKSALLKPLKDELGDRLAFRRPVFGPMFRHEPLGDAQ